MKRPTLALLAALVVAQAGCATSRLASEPTVSASPEEEAQLVADYQRRIQQSEDQLRGVSTSPSAPTCESGCPLIQNICELAGRICQIAGRHPDDAGQAEQCRDANTRCGRARTRVDLRCSCR